VEETVPAPSPVVPLMAACLGPWIWYPCSNGAVLHCATCGEITVTGNFNDHAHTDTPLMSEGV